MAHLRLACRHSGHLACTCCYRQCCQGNRQQPATVDLCGTGAEVTATAGRPWAIRPAKASRHTEQRHAPDAAHSRLAPELAGTGVAHFLANAPALGRRCCNVPGGSADLSEAPAARHPTGKVSPMLKRAFTLLTAAAALLMPTTAAFASIPPHPRWESSALAGTWNYDGFLFQNDMWNCPQAACGKQTMWADSVRDWGAVSDMATGNTAVLTYPDIGKLFNDQPVSHFGLIRNGFTETMPWHIKGLSAEAADDVWLNNYNIEMMIWVDSIGRSLAGGTRIGSATISGQHFTVWKYGSAEFIFDLNHNETSGQTGILASINWLISHGYVPARATLTQVDFGWEIASTHGHPGDFQVSNYWLHTRAR